MVLKCQLVQGEVAVGVRPALPIEDIHLIGGNGLAGSRVWTDTLSPLVKLCPSDLVSEKNPNALQDVSSSCAFTRAMCKVETELSPDSCQLSMKPTWFAGHHLDSQRWKDAMRLYMTSLVTLGRGPEKTMVSDIVLAYLHTDSTLILVTSDWRNRVSLPPT
ncbi:hypothetical protein N1851_003710 [Merluccius polli]|uniref:Uncharacterized protein n=1 Tax=Merluccius polli TaxID=89951 RepID=A0AA47N852_MERPO|nr:hypothetical protein N1851_003710 [Merluccius polli]